eukprot:m.273738 g.273738  ORF g.273738 m.273738 type:complete len:73 (-) comp26886_c3_seq8:4400-4618(-)
MILFIIVEADQRTDDAELHHEPLNSHTNQPTHVTTVRMKRDCRTVHDTRIWPLCTDPTCPSSFIRTGLVVGG